MNFKNLFFAIFRHFKNPVIGHRSDFNPNKFNTYRKTQKLK